MQKLSFLYTNIFTNRKYPVLCLTPHILAIKVASKIIIIIFQIDPPASISYVGHQHVHGPDEVPKGRDLLVGLEAVEEAVHEAVRGSQLPLNPVASM